MGMTKCSLPWSTLMPIYVNKMSMTKDHTRSKVKATGIAMNL